MLSRFKSSLEKRAPGVVGALRSLRGQPEPSVPVVTKPVQAVAPAPKASVVPVVARPMVDAAKTPVEAVQSAAPAPAAPKAAPVNAEAAQAPVKAEAAQARTPVVAPKAAPVKVEAAPVAPKAAPVKAEAAPALVKAAVPKAVGAKTEGKAPEKARNQAADTGSTDIGAYIARAKATGRDPALIKGTEGINVADDGVRYAGPLDNESSREKAADKLLVIDQFECISCGTCVEQTEKVFYLPIDAKAAPIAQDGPMDLIQDAIEACPVTCIHWVTPEEAVERNLTSGVEPGS